MEHIIIEQEPGGLFKLIPEEGYILFDKRTGRNYTIAIVSKENVKYFLAISVK